MDQYSLGVLATSGKENERRLPIHPQHFDRIDADLRARIFLEQGYGNRFGVSDDQLARLVAGLRSRAEIIATTDVVLLPKPTRDDMASLRDGQVLWGWPHAVQDSELTQISIDKHLTLIAWEAMNHWTPSGAFVVHVFHMNNELAGYCSVLQAMALVGSTGHYGRPLTAAVIGFGNTARGAITALHALGVHDVTVLTHARCHRGGLADPVRRAGPHGPHRARPPSHRGPDGHRPGADRAQCSPGTTSWSTACCRTPTRR